MLDAGGLPCHGDWPAFEDSATHGDLTRHPSLVGKAAKLIVAGIDPDLIHRAPATSWIWVTRDLKQMAASQDKFARAIFGQGYHGAQRRRLIRMLGDEQTQLPPAMSAAPHRCLVVQFEDIIGSPYPTASDISIFLDLDLDLAAMAAVVIPRSADCYDGLLETALLASRDTA